MHKVHLRDVSETGQSSPQGKYRLFRRSISQALGGKKDAGTWGGGHPFDLEWVRLPAGASNFPLHQHAAAWELYYFLSGRGEVTTGAETESVGEGDSVLFPPQHAHRITNTGDADLVYFVVGDNPPADITFYPEKEHWGIKPQRKYFTLTEAPYYEPGD